MAPAHSNIKVERTTTGNVTHLRLSGVVDETFPGKRLSQGLSGQVLIDLGRVERISSFGVRQWMEFVRETPPAVNGLYLLHATPMIVDQLGTVDGFAGTAKVLSVLAPYACDSCGTECLRRVDLRADAAAIAENRAPAHKCTSCGKPLEFADAPEEFFAFAKQQSLGDIDAAVERYLASFSAKPAATAQHHTKIVEGDITFVRLTGEIRGDLNVRRVAAGLQGQVAFDFGAVSGVADGGENRVVQMLATAGEDAEVFLWRAPLRILAAMNGKPLPPKVKIATIWLPLPCHRCGEEAPQRILATDYLAELRSESIKERQCVICGGSASSPVKGELKALLEERAAHEPPLAEFESIETRALSKSLVALAASAPALAHTPTGAINAGGQHLQILKRLGQGGMAEVFLARHVGFKGFEKYIVIKKILPQFASQPEFIEMLFAEGRSSARLTHPNIVQVLDVGMMDNSAYITMEYVRGPDLRQLMIGLRKAGVRLPIEHAVGITCEIASALHYAHTYVDPTGVPHPVVHRDVSPHNILISMDGAVKLSDFGIAKAAGEAELTQPGIIKGKIAYLPPEAIAGKVVDGRADLFSLGIVLFELLTAKMPFRRETEAATMRALCVDPPPDPIALNPEISSYICDVLLKMLEKDPDKRYQTGAEFRAALEEAAARSGLHSSPDRVAAFCRQSLTEVLKDHLISPVSGSFPPIQTPSGAASPPRPAGTPAPAPSAAKAPASQPARPAPVEAPARTANGGPAPSPSPAPAAAAAAAATAEAAEANGDADEVSLSFDMIEVDESVRSSPPVPSRTLPSVPPRAAPAPVAPAANTARANSHPAPPPEPLAQPELDGDDEDAELAELVKGRFKAPILTAEPPTGKVAQQSGTTKPAPERKSEPAPSPRPAPRAEARPQPPPEQEPAAAKPNAPARKSRLPLLLGGAGVLIVVGAAIIGVRSVTAKTTAGEETIRVTNLEASERLYVNGVRVEAGPLKLAMAAPVLMGVGRDGALRRFGLMNVTPNLDAAAVPELKVTAGTRAELSVESDPIGCTVTVSGTSTPGVTPMTTFIPAGTEAQIDVTCPGLPRWTRWVLAAPDQKVAVTAKLFTR